MPRSRTLTAALLLAVSCNLSRADDRVYVAVGQGGRRLISTDGVKWELAAESKAKRDDESDNLLGVVYAQGKFVAVGGAYGGHIFVSADGRNWKEVHSPKLRVNPVLYGDGRFVAGAHQGALLWSKDGEDWQKGGQVEAEEATHFRCGAFGNGLFLFIGDAGTHSTVTWSATTKDGEKIENSRVDLPAVRAVAFGNGRFVAVGPDGRRMSSADGRTWEHAVIERGIDLTWVVWNGTHFIAGGRSRTFRSSDGIEWTRDPQDILCRLLYANGNILIGTAGPGQLQSSSDGKGWAKQGMSPSYAINAIAAGEVKNGPEETRAVKP